jgi:branched-chain amino acid transport system permease protein
MMAAKTKKFKLKHFINYILIAALLILFFSLDASGVLKRSTSMLLTQIGYSMILAVSLNLVVGFLGELSLGHAGFMCIGAYIGCFLANYLHTLGMPKLPILLISMVVGGIAAAVAGLLVGLPTLRLKGDYLAIVTLAFGEIVRTIFKNQKIFGGAMGLTTKKYGSDLYIIALLAVLVMLFVLQNFMRSKHGRAVCAIRDNEIAARAMGVNVTYYKLLVFVIAAFFAGVAGVIYGHNTTPVDNTFFGFNYSIEILVMVVLGGMGNITGSLIAAALLTFINVKLTTNLSGDLAALKNLIYALILIVMVIWNNAPALKGLREKISLKRLFSLVASKVSKKSEDEVSDPTGTAAWDKIPTKIPMDAILSTDVSPDRAYEPDKPNKSSGKE